MDWKLMMLAVDEAAKSEAEYQLGAIGIRADGVRVKARNGSPKYPVQASHAETRLCRKLTPDSVVYVARLNKHGIALSKPCSNCEKALRQKGVKKVYYTIGPNEYGVLEF